MVEFWRTDWQIRGWEVDVMENFKVTDCEQNQNLEDHYIYCGNNCIEKKGWELGNINEACRYLH